MKETVNDPILQSPLPEPDGNEVLQNQYIGEILCGDLYSYCANKNVVWKIRSYTEKKKVFHVPAMLLTTGWLAYYGMVKTAVILDIILYIVMNIIPNNLIKIIVSIIYMVLFGFLSIPFYYKHIRKKMDKRGLLMRSNIESGKVSQSLSKEGEASIQCH